ncbi:hypothetical protein JO83_08675 [Avibacterium paragallinarum]|nr:hypothetical protein JO83_08675 [Avibacterium paragallinarum]
MKTTSYSQRNATKEQYFAEKKRIERKRTEKILQKKRPHFLLHHIKRKGKNYKKFLPEQEKDHGVKLKR